MRDSSDSKPTSNGTSRDAISPDVGNMFHVKHQSLTGEKTMNLELPNNDSVPLELNSESSQRLFVYGWPKDDKQDARCLLNFRSGMLSTDYRLDSSQARAIAAMLCAAADVAEGGTYDAKRYAAVIANAGAQP